MSQEITREQRAMAWSIVLAIVLAALGFLILSLSFAGVLGYTPQPTSDPVEPDPWVVGNITKDTHKPAWGLTQYEDDTGSIRTLQGFTANTIYLNYSGIKGHEDWSIGGVNWSDPTKWTQGSCGMQNPSVSLTQEGIVFYAEPWYDFTPQVCSWKLSFTEFEINSKKARWNAGIYFDKIGGYGQWSRLRLEDPSNQPKEYEASSFATVPSEGTMAMRLANKNRTAVFESHIVSEIGSLNEEIASVDELWVWFNANEPWTAGCYETMRMVIYFLEIETTTYQVGYSTSGEKVYRQTQADSNTVALGSFSIGFDYTQIKNLKLQYYQHASDLPDAYVEVQRSQFLSTYRFGYPQPEAISLAYNDVRLKDKLNQDGAAFSEVKLNGQDISYRYDPLDKNDEIELLTGIQEGEQPTVSFENSYSSNEWDGITSGDGGGFFGFGGITAQLVAPFVALGILVAILILAALGKIKESRAEGTTEGDKKPARSLKKDERGVMDARSIAYWVIMGSIIAFIVFTLIAMIRDIPILCGDSHAGRLFHVE
jgi:hypothetical protein